MQHSPRSYGLLAGPGRWQVRCFAHSLNYIHYFHRARQINGGFQSLTPYDFGIGRAAFQTQWTDFPPKLDRWFTLEEQIRARPEDTFFVHGRAEDPAA